VTDYPAGYPGDQDRAILDLLTRCALALDVDDIDACLELFTDDGEFAVLGRVFSGHDRIRAMLESAPHGLHLVGSSNIDISCDGATARSQVLFVEAGTLQLRPALYDDELNYDGQRWKFRRRRCQFITSSGLSDYPEAPSS
jgi:SnoaL-like domain